MLSESRSPLVMQLTPEEIICHIATIRLQQEVVALLAVDAPMTPAITVFAVEQRHTLATTILSAGTDVETTFSLAGR